MEDETKIVNCIGVGTRHTAAVGCIAFSQTQTNFFVSVSQDSCLKLWTLPETLKYNGKLFILRINPLFNKLVTLFFTTTQQNYLGK